jgi:hypothetical protein
MRSSPAFVFCLALFAVSANCSSSGSAADHCVAGASVACTCTNGRTGAQVCDATGAFGRCSCEDGSSDGARASDDFGPDAATADGPRLPARDVDILFMIDNSPSMAKKQANLKRNFPVFMDELKKIRGGIPNVHLAVVSSDLGAGTVRLTNGGCPTVGGDRGVFHVNPNCGLDPNSTFLSSLSNGTINNFQGDISQAFACIADVGDRGCGYEHQLQATRVALYESITPENKGFLRENALLAIILLTDEDDCSAPMDTTLFVDDASFPGTSASFRCAQVGHLCDGRSPPVAPFQAALQNCSPNPGGPLIKVQDVVDSIKQLKKRPDEQIIVSGIYGWPDNAVGAKYEYVKTADGIEYAPECQTSYGDTATPGLRMKQFVEAFGPQGKSFSVCQDDFSPAMTKIADALAARL